MDYDEAANCSKDAQLHGRSLGADLPAMDARSPLQATMDYDEAANCSKDA
eukprot:CAMPEP_0203932178 /NCGR_PEP_ID=MMETSP0359-20131031/70615_1 /ASSEMBLY_ACC=CAM_ASM_000338 /TAXON_ID=268821 /ORGANISM="Scrippsiella Hangoei, Strain SHTV-5" /LENGTH=49 /DNA_ID= /DNA_START= /DNA_END= /DNA_ORIENTATION=